MKKSQEYKAERLALVEKVEGIFALAETEDRELTADERAEVDRITDEESGELTRLGNAEKQAEKDELAVEKWRKELLEAKQPQPKKSPSVRNTDDDKPKSDIKLKGTKSRHFSDPRDAYLSGCWLQAITGQFHPGENPHNEMRRLGWEEYASQTEGTGSKGGYLVPEPMVAEIIRNRDSVGVIPQVSRRFDMSSETLTIPEETSRPTVYYPGEGGTITESEYALEENQLTVKKRACAVSLTKELIADAAISAADYAVETMGYEMAYAMDNEGLNGDGTSTYGGEEGLLNTLLAGQTETAGSGNDTFPELTVAEWAGAIAELPGKYLAASPAWIMSRTAWAGSVLPLSTTAGGTTTMQLQAGVSSLQWMGYPVFLSDLMPAEGASTIAALFGAFPRAIALGDRNDMTIESDSSVYFLQDKVVIKVTHRYDLLVHNTSAFSALKTAS